MDYLYAVANAEQLESYQTFAKKHEQSLKDYLTFLADVYALEDLPEVIIW